jgi:hypothetical protein
MRMRLLYLVKNSEDVKSAFTRDGKIHANLKDGSKALIENPDDLFKIGIDNVDFVKLGLADL